MKRLFRALLICLALCTDLGANKTNQLLAKHIPVQNHNVAKDTKSYEISRKTYARSID